MFLSTCVRDIRNSSGLSRGVPDGVKETERSFRYCCWYGVKHYPINQPFCTSLVFFLPLEHINKPIHMVFLSSIVWLMNWLYIVNVNLENFSVMLNGHHYRRRLPAGFGLCSSFSPPPRSPDAKFTVYP